jgi:hypothetical protein
MGLCLFDFLLVSHHFFEGISHEYFEFGGRVLPNSVSQ